MVASQLEKMGVEVALIDGESVDLIAFPQGLAVMVQVKCALHISGPSYRFNTCRSDGKTKRPITTQDCDIIALAALDIERVVFFTSDEITTVSKRIKTQVYGIDGVTRDTWERCLAKHRGGRRELH